jgi:hypothetical protein
MEGVLETAFEDPFSRFCASFLPAAGKEAARASAQRCLVVLAVLYLVAGLVFTVEWNLPLSQSVSGIGFLCFVDLHAASGVVR